MSIMDDINVGRGMFELSYGMAPVQDGRFGIRGTVPYPKLGLRLFDGDDAYICDVESDETGLFEIEIPEKHRKSIVWKLGFSTTAFGYVSRHRFMIPAQPSGGMMFVEVRRQVIIDET